MPLSKEKNRERMRLLRSVQPNSEVVQPKPMNRYLAVHIRGYPEGFNPDGSYCQDYDPKLDPSINPLLRPPCHLPNSPDGGYHP